MDNPGPKTIRRVAVALQFAGVTIFAIPLLYLVGAVIGSLVPRNAGWEEPRQGIQIFVRTNGIHADIVLPVSAAGVDLHQFMPPADIRDPRQAGGWVAFEWGQREFYLETPRWTDLTLRNAFCSVAGGDALMPVEHLRQSGRSPAWRSACGLASRKESCGAFATVPAM